MNVPDLLIALAGLAITVAVLWLNAWFEDRSPSRTACVHRDVESVDEHRLYLGAVKKVGRERGR